MILIRKPSQLRCLSARLILIAGLLSVIDNVDALPTQTPGSIDGNTKRITLAVVALHLQKDGTIRAGEKILRPKNLNEFIKEKSINTEGRISVQLMVERGVKQHHIYDVVQELVSPTLKLYEWCVAFEQIRAKPITRPPFTLLHEARKGTKIEWSFPLPADSQFQRSKLVKRVEPIYPVQAKAERISGLIELEVLVNEEGAVEEIRLKKGVAKLVASAVVAVSQWRYSPTIGDGEPIPVTATVTVNYTLR